MITEMVKPGDRVGLRLYLIQILFSKEPSLCRMLSLGLRIGIVYILLEKIVVAKNQRYLKGYCGSAKR